MVSKMLKPLGRFTLMATVLLMTIFLPVIPVVRVPVSPLPARQTILVAFWQLVIGSTNVMGVRIIFTPWTVAAIVGLILAALAARFVIVKMLQE